MKCTAPCQPPCHREAAADLLNFKSRAVLGQNCEEHLHALTARAEPDYDRAPSFSRARETRTEIKEVEVGGKKKRRPVPYDVLVLRYLGEPIAIFSAKNTEGDLEAACDAWIGTHGYLAEWSRQWKLGNRIGWSEDLRVAP